MAGEPLQLVVFDWDGTLMDSVGSIVGCTQVVLREMGLGELSDEAVRATVGLGLRETMELLVPECDAKLYGAVLECYRRHWVGTFRDQPVLFQGVPEMLAELAGAGYLLAVATGKSRRGLDYALDETGLRPRFHATRSADEAPSKPHPQMLLDILADLGVAPGNAMMVGDSIYDLQMAANAGSPSVAVLSGTSRREELAAHGQRALLNRVAELPVWLAGALGGR
jgi:phosphoglycolate phosphatase